MVWTLFLYAIPVFHRTCYWSSMKDEALYWLATLKIDHDPEAREQVVKAVAITAIFLWPLFMLIDALDQLRIQDDDK